MNAIVICLVVLKHLNSATFSCVMHKENNKFIQSLVCKSCEIRVRTVCKDNFKTNLNTAGSDELIGLN